VADVVVTTVESTWADGDEEDKEEGDEQGRRRKSRHTESSTARFLFLFRFLATSVGAAVSSTAYK
jgi:hypothetical protein